MTSFKLHVWGALPETISSSAECLATIWYLYLCSHGPQSDLDKIQIIQSSNISVSSVDHTLPALQVFEQSDNTENCAPTRVLTGFYSIVKYIKEKGYDSVDDSLTQKEKAHVNALSVFIDSQVSALTTYLLFMVKPNFEEIIRPVFAKWVPFPMQYNMALDQQDIAQNICAKAGLEPPKPSVSTSSATEQQPQIKDPTLGKILEKAQSKDSLLHQTQSSIQLLTRAKHVYDCVVEFSDYYHQSEHNADDTDAGSNPSYLLGEKLCSADLLLMAHLRIQTLAVLPAPILSNLISEYPLLASMLKSANELQHIDNFCIREPTSAESYSLTNWLKSKLYI